MTRYDRIVLLGFSGTGKTTTARLLARRLGWAAVDIDERLESHFAMSIPEVFERQGEAAFRSAERAELVKALARDSVVIATGGGATVDEATWSRELLGSEQTLTIGLDARPETILARLSEQHQREGAAVARPMLAGNNHLARIAELKSRRQPAYDRADITLVVDGYTCDEVAEALESIARIGTDPPSPAIRLNAPSGASNIHIGPGVLANIGLLARAQWPGAQRAWIISDANVASHWAAPVESTLDAEGFKPILLEVPPGEASKSLATAGSLYDQLLSCGIERGDIVLALGGGVIGDLAGFVAATVLRGVGLIQIPTSLLAMVDSSVGGKTGINHSAGKNLIGSFYQPALVVIDPLVLETLPARELSQGWAEIVKHAIIQVSTPGGEAGDLGPFLRRNIGRLLSLNEPALTYLIRRNVALKCRVVEADERESGIRSLLNFGHTFGHAIEASDYRYLHGEAIALGMRAAARLSRNIGSIPQSRVDAIDDLLDCFKLPSRGAFDMPRVVSLLGSDKKRSRGQLTWVVIKASGGVEVRREISLEAVTSALAEIQEGHR